jgi:hypothetical protein
MSAYAMEGGREIGAGYVAPSDRRIRGRSRGGPRQRGGRELIA